MEADVVGIIDSKRVANDSPKMEKGLKIPLTPIVHEHRLRIEDQETNKPELSHSQGKLVHILVPHRALVINIRKAALVSRDWGGEEIGVKSVPELVINGVLA